MLTDGTAESWDGVRDMADEVARKDGSVGTTLFLGLLVFAVGAAAGFLARLLWPHSR
jgi:hypothetical protein